LSFVVVGVYDSLNTLISLVIQIPIGRFIDKYGEKPSFIISFLANSICLALFVAFTKINPLLALTMLLAKNLFTAFYGNASRTYIAKKIDKSVLSSFYCGMSSLSSIISMIGPSIGYILWSINVDLPFITYISGLLLLAILSTKLK